MAKRNRRECQVTLKKRPYQKHLFCFSACYVSRRSRKNIRREDLLLLQPVGRYFASLRPGQEGDDDRRQPTRCQAWGFLVRGPHFFFRRRCTDVRVSLAKQSGDTRRALVSGLWGRGVGGEDGVERERCPPLTCGTGWRGTRSR